MSRKEFLLNLLLGRLSPPPIHLRTRCHIVVRSVQRVAARKMPPLAAELLAGGAPSTSTIGQEVGYLWFCYRRSLHSAGGSIRVHRVREAGALAKAQGRVLNREMRCTLIVAVAVAACAAAAVDAETSFWRFPGKFLENVLLRRGKTERVQKTPPPTTSTTVQETTGTDATAGSTTTYESTTQEVTGTTEESRDNHRPHDFYLTKREKPQVKIASNISQNLLPLPAGASAALVKPTKYHYYPHNQHIYLLPECAIQQVCNAVYVRLNWTQPLCACPSRYRDPCSASLNSDDLHTTELMIDKNSKKALTLVKTCEPIADMRICRTPRDWSLLALQNVRTGKSHYLVICRCPDSSILEGPISHDQPTYASVPGIRVYGMMCVDGNKRRGRPLRLTRAAEDDDHDDFPWEKAVELARSADWD